MPPADAASEDASRERAVGGRLESACGSSRWRNSEVVVESGGSESARGCAAREQRRLPRREGSARGETDFVNASSEAVASIW